MADIYRVRVGIDWNKAEEDTLKFIQTVQGQIRGILAAANAAGTPEASAAAGADLASLYAQLKNIPKPFVEARLAAKSLLEMLERIGGVGGQVTKTLGLGRMTGVGAGIDKRTGEGRLTQAQIGNIDVSGLRGGFADENTAISNRLQALRAAISEAEQMQENANQAVQRRLTALRQSIANENAYAAESKVLVGLARTEAVLRRTRLAAERAAIERGLRNTPDFIRDEAAAAADRRVREAETRRRTNQNLDAGGGRLIQDEAASIVSEQRRKAAIDRAALANRTQADLINDANDRLAAERNQLELRLRTAAAALGESQKQLSVEKDISALKAQVLAAEGRRAARERAAADRLALQTGTGARASNVTTRQVGVVPTGPISPAELAQINAGLPQFIAGTRRAAQAAIAAAAGLSQTATAANRMPGTFQRLYAQLHSRQGNPMQASAAPTARQFIASRALNTIGYGLSGGLLYGGIAFGRELIREATELETQLGILESQFDSLEEGAAGISFDGFRSQILSISRETGVAADEVASISRQLAGALAEVSDPNNTPGNLRDDVITPNFRDAGRVTEIALGLSQITGLPRQEAADSFSATLLAFQRDGESAEATAQRIADAVVGLEARFGVASTEVLNFTASLASIGAESGFTIEQLAGLGAVVEQAVGSDVAAAENMGRIFASLADNQLQIAELFRNAGQGDAVRPLLDAFANNNLPEVLRQIVEVYQQLGESDRGVLGNLVGGDRQARTFFAVLERGSQVLNALETEGGDFGGAFEARLERFRETVAFAFQELQRKVEEFGLAIFESGLADALLFVADVLGDVATVARLVLEAFSGINSALNGMPAKLLLAAAGFRALAAGGRVAAAAGSGARSATLIPFGNLSAAPGGLRSPYTSTGVANLGGAFIPTVGLNRVFQNRFAGPNLFGNLAQRGGALGGTASLVGNLSPLIAAAAVTSLISTVDQVGGELAEARESIRDKVRQRLSEGVSAAEIRRRFEASPGGGRLSAAERIGGFLTGGAEGTRDPIDIGLEEAAEAARENQAAMVLEQLRAASEANQSQIDPNATVRGVASYRQENIDRIISDIEEDPGNYDPQRVIDILNQVAEGDAWLNDVYNAIGARYGRQFEAQAEVQEAAGRLLDPQRAVNLQTALAQFERGEISIDLPRQLMEQQVADLRSQIDSGVNDPDMINSLIDAENALSGLIGDYYTGRAELAATIAGLLGQDGPEFNISNAANLLAQLQNSGAATQEQLQNAIIQLAEAEQQAFMERVESIEDVSQRLAAAEAGFDYSEAVQRGIVALQLSLDGNRESIEQVAPLIGQSVEWLSNEVVDTMVEYSTDAATAMRIILAARAATVARLIAITSGLRQVQNFLQFGTLLGQIAATATGPLPGISLPRGSASKEWSSRLQAQAQDDGEAERLAEEARRERQAAALARLSVEEARANGDPVRIAQIAQQRARLNQQFAETESERLEAMAQYIEASNQLQDAFDDIASAQRDLALARSGDDPVDAARAAIADANAAMASANGEAERLRAEAERIRADRQLVNAIQEIADSQIDILVAMAEASGDSVEAARLNAERIRQRLANAEGLGLSEAERNSLNADLIRADASVRDAVLAEERATIQYQMEIGQITKQQALTALQALLQIPNLTEEQIRELNLEIQRLRNDLGADFRYNLPTQLALPTTYEVRRLGDTGGSGAGYQDNRQIIVTVNAETNADPDQIATAVVNAVGQPNRYGAGTRRY